MKDLPGGWRGLAVLILTALGAVGIVEALGCGL